MGPLPPAAGMPPSGPTRPEDYLNIRDALSAFVGNGYTDMGNTDARALYSSLRARLGPAVAQKMLIHLQQFNQRPDVLQKSPEQRVQALYDIGSRDPEVGNILDRTKMVAQGPVPGFREAPEASSMQLEHRKMYNKGPIGGAAALSSINNAALSIR